MRQFNHALLRVVTRHPRYAIRRHDDISTPHTIISLPFDALILLMPPPLPPPLLFTTILRHCHDFLRFISIIFAMMLNVVKF